MVATDGYQHPVADPPVPRPAAQYKRRLARAATARAEEEALTQRNLPSALQRCTVEGSTSCRHAERYSLCSRRLWARSWASR